MPRALRIQYPGAFHHMYNRGVAKGAIFHDRSDRNAFLSLLGKMLSKSSFRALSYCLMDNHFHLFLIQTSDEAGVSLSGFMREFCRQYVRRFNNIHERVGPLFQGRFQSRLVTDDIYAKVLLRYIHLNPCLAGLTSNPNDYEWSSYSGYAESSEHPSWLDLEFGLGLFDTHKDRAITLFKKFHGDEVSEDELRILRNFRKPLSSPHLKRYRDKNENTRGFVIPVP